MKRLIYLFWTLVLSINLAYGQFTFDANIHSYFDDNLFRTPAGESDIYTRLGTGIHFEIKDLHSTFSYSPDLFLFRTNTGRNFTIHPLSLDYFNTLMSDRLYLFAGAGITNRINQSDYNYYDYSQIHAYFNMRMDLRFLYLRTGYQYRHRNYPQFNQITNSQHKAFVQVNKSFETRTTLIAEAGIGTKSFQEYQSYRSIMETYTSTYGWQGGRGRGREIIMTDTNYTALTETIDPPRLNQASLLFRVTQSVRSNIGMYAQYMHQFSLTDDTRFQNLNLYFQDEELFDDPFSYESDEADVRLTWILPWSSKLVLGYSRLSKDYISEQAYTSATDTTATGGDRQDTRDESYLMLTKNISLNRALLKTIQFSLQFSYMDNRSNSFWYNYKNLVAGMGMTFRL